MSQLTYYCCFCSYLVRLLRRRRRRWLAASRLRLTQHFGKLTFSLCASRCVQVCWRSFQCFESQLHTKQKSKEEDEEEEEKIRRGGNKDVVIIKTTIYLIAAASVSMLRSSRWCRSRSSLLQLAAAAPRTVMITVCTLDGVQLPAPSSGAVQNHLQSQSVGDPLHILLRLNSCT